MVPDAVCSVLIRPDSSSKAHSATKGQHPSHQTAGNSVQLQHTEVLTYKVIARYYTSPLENITSLRQVHVAVWPLFVYIWPRFDVCFTDKEITCLFL